MTITAIKPLLKAATVIALAVAANTAFAQPFPTKPIRLIVPLAPGSTADIASRFTANELGKALGQTVVVDNKTGAGGTIAMAELASVSERRTERLVNGALSRLPRFLTAVGSLVVFIATTPEHGQELWRTDGTAGGTERVSATR